MEAVSDSGSLQWISAFCLFTWHIVDGSAPPRGAYYPSILHDGASSNDGAHWLSMYGTSVPAGNMVLGMECGLIDYACSVHIDEHDVGIRANVEHAFLRKNIPDL
jgi:hypothetical protein